MNVPPYTLNLFHVLIVAPTLMYIAKYKDAVDPRLYTILFYTAILLAAFHSYKAYIKVTGQNY